MPASLEKNTGCQPLQLGPQSTSSDSPVEVGNAFPQSLVNFLGTCVGSFDSGDESSLESDQAVCKDDRGQIKRARRNIADGDAVEHRLAEVVGITPVKNSSNFSEESNLKIMAGRLYQNMSRFFCGRCRSRKNSKIQNFDELDAVERLAARHCPNGPQKTNSVTGEEPYPGPLLFWRSNNKVGDEGQNSAGLSMRR